MTGPTFHAGERAVQTRVGVESRMAELGPRVIRDFMPDQHRAFFAQLPLLLVGSVDAQGQPWASVLTGAPGFLSTPDARTLLVRSTPTAGDPLVQTLASGSAIGLLGIEPHTRRRNRVNGVLQNVTAQGFEVAVQQSFGNCPKYIQAREATLQAVAPGPVDVVDAPGLDAAARRIVAAADTLFIATDSGLAQGGQSSLGADVSHRGGKPGFVRVDGDDTLTMPDFAGNAFFNTLGNITLNPRAGLLFIDYSTGDLLHIAVTADIVWDGPALQAFSGAQRLLRFKVRSMRRLRGALPLRWGEAELSPFVVPTGDWSGQKPH